ncbi:MAG: polysaccharide deacetylase family protein [Brotaphodocola sp.]
MKRLSFDFHHQISLFLAILFLDAALLGTTGAAAKTFYDKDFQSESVYRTEGSVNQKELFADAPAQSFCGQVALTFDDGPHPVQTKRLLDGLKERNVKVTFFLMGENIKGNEEIVKQMQEDGHLIGNHSYSHIQLTKTSEEAVCEAIERTEEIIKNITGERPEYLRPPYGDWSESLECRLDLIPVFWSVDSLDWKLKNTKKIVDKVLKKTGDGDIILMHDIFPFSVDAALQIVDELKQRGYTFVTAEELLID